MRLLVDEGDREMAEFAARVRDAVRDPARKGQKQPLTKFSVALARIDATKVRVSYRGGSGNAAGYVVMDFVDVGVESELELDVPETSADADITIGIPSDRLDDDEFLDALATVLSIIA
jgi:hypothetical protein